MKLIICIFFYLFILKYCQANDSIMTSGAKLQAHLRLMNEFKAESEKFLNSLYRISNRIRNHKSDNIISQDSEKSIDEKLKEYHGEHSSKTLKKDKLPLNSTTQFNHRDFDNVIQTLKELAKKYPKYMVLTSAQKEFNLPNPGGKCSDKKE